MSPVRDGEAAELGERLRVAGFQPLPDVDVHGELAGIRLWRLRGRYVELVSLRRNGSGHAVRAEAHYDYRHPFDHGPIVDHHVGYVVAAVDWLLDSSPGADPEPEPEAEREPPQGRPYLDPPPPRFDWLGGNDPGGPR